MAHTSRGQKLIWEDEFNTGTLDLNYWSYETGTGVNGDFGTGQVDRATDRPENVSFLESVNGAENGVLVISTRREHYIDREYTSGRIISAGKNAWGPGHRIEARIKPAGVKYQGQGFAFWLMPDEVPSGYDFIMWPQGGEVDIMEYVGSLPYHNLGSVHYAWFWENNEYRDWNHGHMGYYYSFETAQVPDPEEPVISTELPDANDPASGSSEFHVYGIDWYPDRMEFFVDYNVYHIHYFNDGAVFAEDGEDEKSVSIIDSKRTGISEYSHHFDEWRPFEHEMFLILSAGVTGAEYSYGGPVTEEAVFPADVYIDWVRVSVLDDNIVTSSAEPEERNILVHPNPFENTLTLHLPHQGYEIKLLDQSGRIVLQKPLPPSGTLNLQHLPAGFYLLEAAGPLGVKRQRVIKR